ncbi:tail fiber assembly protein [Enterobacter cancerogenus]|uniref:tail fiber assembly protein n=1 Tax=Enterobacter cancerogenus TaxID=69218 RepID=UPI001CA42974|nr:tail fiber assembly protein [Enterobacter cancerogenus]QZY35077.1 tail fiber assembly protein [Enterobacter cancerogenus]
MKIYNNFTPYAPEGDDLPANVLFLRSDTGVDWYDAQKEFKESTLKVMFDSAGIICCAETDASGLWPVDCSVVEIDDKEVPVDFVASSGGWIFDGKKITARKFSKEEFQVKAEAQKTRLMNAATAAIAPLQDAEELGMATEVELTALSLWKRYRVMLNRVDTSSAPDIEWPVQPQG